MGLLVKKPISVLDKNLKASWREVFKILGKSLVHAATGKLAELPIDAVELGAAIGLAEEPGDAAWLLIRRSIIRALETLLREHRDLFATEPPDDAKLSEVEAGLDIDSEVLELDETFFSNPVALDLLDRIRSPLAEWLKTYGVQHTAALAIAERLRPYFVLALHDEWARSPSDYAKIRESIQTPFTVAQAAERAWLRYEAYLWRVVNEPMFAEAFGLRSVFIEPRAYWREAACNSPRFDDSTCHDKAEDADHSTIYHVVSLFDELDSWLTSNRSEDSIRVLSGGPGCGKSSFARMFAAATASRGQVRVLYIPLYLFDHRGDLVTAIGDYVQSSRILPTNPLEVPTGEEPRRLLLIFDGLDELAMQGKLAADGSREFVQEVEKTVSRLNMLRPWLSVLISGREMVVQANEGQFRRPRQILHLLGHAKSSPTDDTSRGELHDPDGSEIRIDDPNELLGRDLRTEWWHKYRNVTGVEPADIPPEFLEGELGDITAQPLLLYLVALSYRRRKLQLSPDTNLNDVYEDLINAVWERGWERNRRLLVTQSIERNQFMRILEEIGLAAWHDESRTTTIRAIRERFEASGLERLLDNFEQGAEAGVTRLLAAFYFRQFGDREGDRRFEFTHKSFGEYLAMRRAVRTMDIIERDMKEHDDEPDRGKDVASALAAWIEICGPAPLDAYYVRFLNREVARRGAERAKAWQIRLQQMLSCSASSGSPVERLKPRPATFQLELRRARNAEEALFVAAAACADVTKQITRINWPTSTVAGEWLRRLQGQRTSPRNIAILGSLRRVALDRAILHGIDLYRADLSGASLQHCEMSFAWLMFADFQSADLQHARLDDCNLRSANLSNANLRSANLEDANLRMSNLQAADLREARLSGANLHETNLQSAILSDIDFQWLWAKRANLSGANLARANLSNATLGKANLEGANLEGANLEGANLEGANLEGANLEGANLHGAILKDANLIRAKLANVDLANVDLSVAKLVETAQQEGDVSEASMRKYQA